MRLNLLAFLLTITFLSDYSLGQSAQVTNNALLRTFMIQTNFSFDFDHREYWITAKHVLIGIKTGPAGAFNAKTVQANILSEIGEGDEGHGQHWITATFAVIEAGKDIDILAKKVTVVGAGVGEDMLDALGGAARVGTKIDPSLAPASKLIDERNQELQDDNADNPGLRTTGRITGVVVPALASGATQAAARVAGAALEGASDGVMQEVAKHGLDAKSLLGAAVKKGGRTYVVNQLGSS